MDFSSVAVVVHVFMREMETERMKNQETQRKFGLWFPWRVGE